MKKWNKERAFYKVVDVIKSCITPQQMSISFLMIKTYHKMYNDNELYIDLKSIYHFHESKIWDGLNATN